MPQVGAGPAAAAAAAPAAHELAHLSSALLQLVALQCMCLVPLHCRRAPAAAAGCCLTLACPHSLFASPQEESHEFLDHDEYHARWEDNFWGKDGGLQPGACCWVGAAA